MALNYESLSPCQGRGWWVGGWWVVQLSCEIKAISAQSSWRLVGWLGLSLATKVNTFFLEHPIGLCLLKGKIYYIHL